MRIWTCLLFCLLPGLVTAQDTFPLPAHSHNDYLRPRPLFDALNQRFASVEVDIHWVNDQLQVAHTREETVAGRTLSSLYLEPLRLIHQVYEGSIYPETTTPLIVLVDIKSDAEETYTLLQRTLAPYEPLLTRFTETETTFGAVTIIVSGNRPRELIAAESPRYVGYDGRLEDLLSGEVNRHFMPMVSDNWTAHFRWDGEGDIPAEELDRLRDLAQRARDAGVLLRFWNIPDRPRVWSILRAAGVGLIGTDRIEELSVFLLN